MQIQGDCWTLWPLCSVHSTARPPPNTVVPQCAKSHSSNFQGYKLCVCLSCTRMLDSEWTDSSPPHTLQQATFFCWKVNCTPGQWMWSWGRCCGSAQWQVTCFDSPPPWGSLPVPCCSDGQCTAGQVTDCQQSQLELQEHLTITAIQAGVQHPSRSLLTSGPDTLSVVQNWYT